MQYNKAKFKNSLEQQKKLISKMFKEKDKELLKPINNLNDELALVYAEFKCENCKDEENLQYHHLIKKIYERIMDSYKYLSQRNYWANIMVLCRKCHAEIEERTYSEGSKAISEGKIERIKKKYDIQ